MNNFLKIISLVVLGLIFLQCNNDDTPSESTIVLRDYAAQLKVDNDTINKFLDNYYLNLVNNPGQLNDMDVSFSRTPLYIGQPKINDMPNLKTRSVTFGGIEYKIKYLELRKGSGVSPCNVDGVIGQYTGNLIPGISIDPSKQKNMVVFDSRNNPNTFNDLSTSIRGWGEIFPQFKSGTVSQNANGSLSYNDFGAGIMFLPSAMGYYNGSVGGATYAPLIFSFKLYNIARLDQDFDGINSIDEDLNKDGYIYATETGIVNPDDTDQDGTVDAGDSDDDGDNYLTKVEISYTNPLDPYAVVRYYPFNGAAVDDPTTLFVDETKGVPTNKTSTADYTSATRKRIYLNKEVH